MDSSKNQSLPMRGGTPCERGIRLKLTKIPVEGCLKVVARADIHFLVMEIGFSFIAVVNCM